MLRVVNNVAVFEAIKINRVGADTESNLTTTTRLVQTSCIDKNIVFESSIDLRRYTVLDCCSGCYLSVNT